MEREYTNDSEAEEENRREEGSITGSGGRRPCFEIVNEVVF